jgi:hypothetical protein
MCSEQEPGQRNIWTLLCWQGPPRRILLRRGISVFLALSPLGALLVLLFRDRDQPLPLSTFLIANIAVNTLLACIIVLILYGMAIALYLKEEDARLAFTLVEWGNGVALCLAVGLFVCGIMLCFVR